ncbi:MAG: FtsQ-type POTRA domain-containing protein [Lachnospiraceae bacterium]|nr:FtsQ-type POTRA domain-containing protein [Lachnospiraceae bacterium]
MEVVEFEVDSKPRKKKRKFGLYCFVVVTLAIAIAIVGFVLLFHLQNIEITGNDYSTPDEVVQWIQQDQLSSNSLYVVLKHKFTTVKELPYVEVSEVRLKNPWTIAVRIYEKKMIGYVATQEKYVYFDKDGMVVKETTELVKDIPLIEGLEVTNTMLYKVLPVADKDVFQYIVDVTQMAKKYQLTPDRIVCSGKDINLYFGSICIQLGHDNLSDRMLQIPAILPNLQGKTGTLHLENFSDTNTTSGFIEEVPVEQSVPNE